VHDFKCSVILLIDTNLEYQGGEIMELNAKVQKQYCEHEFIRLEDFEQLIANKANAETNINMEALSTIAQHLGAEYIAEGCRLDEIHRLALMQISNNPLSKAIPSHSFTLKIPNRGQFLLYIYNNIALPEDTNLKDSVLCLREEMCDTNHAAKYHVRAYPMGPSLEWDTFGLLIPEAVLYNYMYALTQDFWKELAQLRDPKVNEVLSKNITLANILNVTHWVPSR
jgi:hypothetical protein